MKIKMHALYDHFPDLTPKESEKYIECYADMNILECKGGNKNFAILLEPRSMIGPAYEYCEQHSDYFRYIFTHDSRLLKLDKAYPLIWCTRWIKTDSEKNKGISLCTSNKNWCPLHNARIELAKRFEKSDKVDVFWGDWNNPKIPTVKPEDYLEHYKFSIAIENDIDEYWFTEKIVNCFGAKTVPIYLGATKLNEFFNEDGIIRVDKWEDIPDLVENLNLDVEYAKRYEAIEENYKRSEQYIDGWKDRFFSDYGTMLGDMYNE